MKRNAWLLTLVAGLAALLPPAAAQSEEPGKGVARISLIQGDVSVRRGDSGDWVAAAINAPLLAEDRVLTGAASRAEVQFDYYHRIRLAADSEIRLTQLEYRLYQIQVVRGTVTFSALKGGDAQVEINTPAAALRPVAWGEYRVTVFDDDRAELTVRRGEAEIFTPSGTQRLRPGRTMAVRLTPDNRAEFQYLAEIPRDAWDDFNRNRDRELSRAADVYRYVSRDIYGAEDLYGHGHWVYVAPYGWCWQPVVAVGWAPYRFGRWVWLDWYGWTWISYDPWGWAPYHYGRWFWWNNAWLWYPGAVVGVRHWWSPALVAWFGWSSWGGFTAGFGFGWGAVGWVPLAPFEPLYPWWGRRFAGYRGVNYVYQNTTIIHNTNITNIYRNARVRDGVTVVRGDDFVRGQVGRPLRLGGEELARASVARGALPFAPARESLRLADREPTVRRASLDSGREERFFSRRAVGRAERIPFEEQRRTFEQWTAREAPTLGRREATAEGFRGGGTDRSAGAGEASGGRGGWRTAEPRSGSPGLVTRSEDVGRSRVESRVEEGSRTGGWRRVEEPAGRSESRFGESNWRRFGDPGVGARSEERAPARVEPRSEDAGRTGSGWRSFGDPGRVTPRVEPPRWSTGNREEDGGVRVSPRWSTGGGASEGGGIRVSPRMETPAVDGTRGDTPRWSTGGRGSESEGIRVSPRMETPRGDVIRGETPRWSTGGGVSEGGGIRVSPRMEMPRVEPRGEPARGGEGRGTRQENRFAPMSRGGWSTGGWTGGVEESGGVRGDTGRSSWRSYGESPTWSTGAGIVDLSPRSSPRADTPRWSTGGASPRTGWAGDGFGGARSAPSYGGPVVTPRSAPSFGGSIGGGRSSPGFGGGIGPSPGISGGGIRGGGIGASPSFGGARSGAGFGGGATRSAPSGGGGVRGGRGR
jgi:hypothetical protein